MKIIAKKKVIGVIIVSSIAIFMFAGPALAQLDRPVTEPFQSYQTVSTKNLEIPKSQTVYLAYNMPGNAYFKIIKADNTIVLSVNWLTNPLPKSVYLEAGIYTVEAYGGDGMANGTKMYSKISLEITYIKTGKLIRVIEGTGPFTTKTTTTIYYDWSGGNTNTSTLGYLGSYKLGSLQFSGPTPQSEGPYPNPNGGFVGKPGTYTVQCTGGYYTPPMTSTIYCKGTVDIWYDDTKPKITMDSSKKGQWVKGSSDGSITVDYQISFPEGTPNSPDPLLVKVFFGPEGQTASLYKSHSYNPKTPTSITGNWPVPADVNGRYQAYAELWENNGTNLFLKTSNRIDFNIDNTPPTLNVTRSPDKAFYSTATTPTVNFDYTAGDTGSGLYQVVVNIDGMPQAPALLAASGTYSWNIPNTGLHTISLTAYDSAGNQSTQTFTVHIDNTHPEFPGNLQVTPAPTYLSYLNSEIVTYGWAAVNEENFKEYRIKIESAYLNHPTAWTTVRDWTSIGSNTQYVYNIPAACNGQMLRATVKAVDLAGNEASISKTIISDQTAPAVTLPAYATRFQTGTAPGTGKVVCHWNGSNDNMDGVMDSGSGIDYYEAALTETVTAPDHSLPLQSATTSTGWCEFANVSSDGSYFLWVRAIDRAGNRGVWAMSGPFPDFQATGPANHATVATAVFQATARTPLPDNHTLQFQLKYKRTDANTYNTWPGGYQSTGITPGLNYGNWNWYLELKEYDQAGNPIPESSQTTEVFTFHIENDQLAPVILQPILTTPGAMVQFSATVAEPERIVSYRWETGDQHTLFGHSPQHSYSNDLDLDPVGKTAAKVYPLTVTVAFTDGSDYTAQTTVTVQNTGKGTLHTHEIWQGIHHIYDDVTVPAGILLTILPGTQVIVHQSPGQTGYSNALNIQGTLISGEIGGSETITFTVDHNASLDGWRGISITGNAQLFNVSISKAQRAITTIGTNSVTIKNCVISQNYTGVHVCGGHPAISGTTFSDNTLYAIKEENGWPKVTHCTFTGNGVDYYHDTLTKITVEQLNTLPDRGNEGNGDQE